MSEEEPPPDEDDEDDWFERALRESDEAGPGDGEDGTGSPESETGGAGAGSTETGAGSTEAESGEVGTGTPDDAGDPPDGEFDGDDADDLPGGEFDGGDADDLPGGEFEEGDAGDAFGEASGTPGEGGSGDAFGESFGSSMGEAGADDDVFGDDFATAFENAPGPGGGGAPQAADSGFEEEDFESAIPRTDIGIEGLDEMIQGGVPERALMVSIGDAGTGKTTFGLQFLRHGLEQDEKGVFITLEEEFDAIVSTADDKGWGFSEHIDDGRLVVLDLDPIQMANSLTSIRNELPGLVREFGASRLVLDSVSLLEMMYEDQAARRTQIYDFTRSLKNAGVTTMLTSEASEEDPVHSRFGIIEYLTDAVFVLRYVRPDDFRETRLAIEIQKIRNANHSREMKPYEITADGINVYRQANIF